jgi:hypothetical protein
VETNLLAPAAEAVIATCSLLQRSKLVTGIVLYPLETPVPKPSPTILISGRAPTRRVGVRQVSSWLCVLLASSEVDNGLGVLSQALTKNEDGKVGMDVTSPSLNRITASRRASLLRSEGVVASYSITRLYVVIVAGDIFQVSPPTQAKYRRCTHIVATVKFPVDPNVHESCLGLIIMPSECPLCRHGNAQGGLSHRML